MEMQGKLSVEMPSGCRLGCLEKSLFYKGFSTLTTKTTHNYKKNKIKMRLKSKFNRIKELGVFPVD